LPWDRSRYPDDWEERRARILIRAGNRCECTGECGLHQAKFEPWIKRQPRRCRERNGQKAIWAKGMIVLTIAHLDERGPLDCPDERLKAMCQRCHLRMDRPLHARNASHTRMLSKEVAGQEPLFPERKR
jgi:hypothetical protein